MPTSTQRHDLPSRLDRRLAVDSSFWIRWLRRPALDAAESILRLRRLRGLSQEQLAKLMDTHQPAVARLESGRGNVGVETLVKAAEALDAVVRVQFTPVESLAYSAPWCNWWEMAAPNAREISLSIGSVVGVTPRPRVALADVYAGSGAEASWDALATFRDYWTLDEPTERAPLLKAGDAA